MNFIFLSDLHLTDKSPVARTDNFTKAQWSKVRFIFKYAKKKKAVIVQAGDWNDKARSWDVLYKTVKMIMEYGLDILTIPGQHDMYHGVSEESTPTILSVLRASKLVTILGKEPVKLGGVNFYGAPWGAKVPSIITSGTNILVIHAPIMKEAIYYGAEGINPKRFLKKHKFDIVLAGDIHREFTEKFSKRRLFNTGPVLRKSAEQYSFVHEPNFRVFDSETGKVKRIVIPHKPAEKILTRSHIVEKKGIASTMDAFIQKINKRQKKFDSELSFEEFLSASDADKSVLRLIALARPKGAGNG